VDETVNDELRQPGDDLLLSLLPLLLPAGDSFQDLNLIRGLRLFHV
jgi:hypothetical protein